MDIVDQLAEIMVKEKEKKGKRLSFELARLTVEVETCDSMVRTMMHDPEVSVEKMADFLNVSVWLVKVSISRHKSGKKAEPESSAVAWEQILEMRKRDDPKSKWSDERKAYYEKDFSLRISEQVSIAEIFLTNTTYSVKKIARLVGLSVSAVEKLKGNLQPAL